MAGEIFHPLIEDLNDEIEKTISEMSTIITTELSNRTRWDTPTKGMRKDRYSAVLCAYHATRTILGSLSRPTSLISGFWA